jgi:hypothetical protein
MKRNLTLHYSIRSGGDGSAFAAFVESKELAQWDQDHQIEGWGETCLGEIKLESDSPITTTKEITTAASYLVNLIDGECDETKEFLAEFFPNGRPVFTVQTEAIPGEKPTYKYVYNNVYANGIFAKRVFRRKDELGQVFEDLLNSYEAEED